MRSQWQIDQGKQCSCGGADEYCPCQNVNKAEAEISDSCLFERARDILTKHHKWQCEAEGLVMEFEHEGKTERLDISLEYGDSTLCEETTEVLAALNRKLRT